MSSKREELHATFKLNKVYMYFSQYFTLKMPIFLATSREHDLRSKLGATGIYSHNNGQGAENFRQFFHLLPIVSLILEHYLLSCLTTCKVVFVSQNILPGTQWLRVQVPDSTAVFASVLAFLMMWTAFSTTLQGLDWKSQSFSAVGSTPRRFQHILDRRVNTRLI